MSLSSAVAAVGDYTYFAARALPAAVGAVLRPRSYLQPFHDVFVGALPLAYVTGLALGAVIWLHLHGVLARMGSDYVTLLPQALALAVVLEFAPLGAGFIVAGRSGASLGAELGSMRLPEPVDALQMLGLSPWRHLVAPRVLACMAALPLLTVIIAALALAGSFAAEMLGGTMSARQYWNECLRNLRLEDVVPAVLKTVVFGYLIGVTGCYCGLNAEGGTEGVGRAATRAVVVSICLVVVSNVVLVRLIQLLA